MMRALIAVVVGFYAAAGFMLVSSVMWAKINLGAVSLDSDMIIGMGFAGALAGWLLRDA